MGIIKYKKLIKTMSLLLASVLLTTGCGDKDKADEVKEEIKEEVIDTTEKASEEGTELEKNHDFKNWVGKYTYNEMIAPGHPFDMVVNVYEGGDGVIAADVSVKLDAIDLDDTYKATVTGDKDKVDLYFVGAEGEKSENSVYYICSLVLENNEVEFENVNIFKFYDGDILKIIDNQGAASWIDVYEFTEEVSPWNSYTTEIYMYTNTDSDVCADITVSGFQTSEEYEAEVKGDREKIDFYDIDNGKYICSLSKKNDKVVFDSGIISNLYREIEEPGVPEETKKPQTADTKTSAIDSPEAVYNLLISEGEKFETTGEKYFYEKKDFDSDGNQEIIYSVLEKDGGLDERSYSDIYYLKVEDGKLKFLQQNTYLYNTNELKFVNVEGIDEYVLYIGITNYTSVDGFALEKITADGPKTYQLCVAESGQGRDAIVDFDDDRDYDGFKRERWDNTTKDNPDINLYRFTEDGFLMMD